MCVRNPHRAPHGITLVECYDRSCRGWKKVGWLRVGGNARVGDTSDIVARVSDAGIVHRRKVR